MKTWLYIIATLFILGWLFTDIPFGFLVVSAMFIFAMIWLKKCSSEKFNQTLKEIDLMSGEEFEHYVAHLFRKMGYKAEVTKASGDYGADVVAARLHHGKIEKSVIQCKRYQGKVGISAVQEVVGAKAYYKAEKAFVVTNSHFTDAAVHLAESNKVTLWNRETLETQIKKASKKEEY